MTGVLCVAAWGTVVLAAIDGWGGLAALLAVNIKADAGLRLAWGMAMLLAVGGILTALGLATQPVVVGVVLAGVAFAMPRWRRDASWRWVGPMGCVAGLILALHYLGQVAGIKAVCTDDNVAYWGFIKRQLILGAVNEPFSLRRLASHGGQVFLQSLVDAEGGLDNSFLIERGIAPVIIYLLLRGAMPGRGPALAALALTLTMLTPWYDFNSQSLCTGIVLFLGLTRTLVTLDVPPRSRPGELVLVGLLAGGLAALRVMFLAGAGLIVAGWLLLGWGGLRTLRGLSWRAAIIACGSLIGFLPWMIGLWRSSGTPLFPLFAGTGAVGLDTFSASGAKFNDLALLYTTNSDGLFLCIPLLIIWRAAPERRVLCISYAAALSVILLFAVSFPDAVAWDLARYMWPMVATPVLLTAVVAARATNLHQATWPVVIVLVAGALAISGLRLAHDRQQLARATDPGTSSEDARLARVYRDLQGLVPAGEQILVATDRPYLVDYARNKTSNLDTPGFASPAPGMPFFHGPDPVRDYLLARGIHYVLYVDGMQANPCLYDRVRYRSPKMRLTPFLWQLQARYILDFLGNMDHLAARETVLGEQDHHILLRLDNR